MTTFLKVASYSVHDDLRNPYNYLGSISVIAFPEPGREFYATDGRRSGYFHTIAEAAAFIAEPPPADEAS